MAKISRGKFTGLRPLFDSQQVQKDLERRRQKWEEQVILTLQFLGEEFVNKARGLDTYQDRTGNLRASIGYIILKDGKIVDQNFLASPRGTDKTGGIAFARQVAGEVANDFPEGFVLIGVAGMSYARYVEDKGFDVITGSAPTDEELQEILNEIEL